MAVLNAKTRAAIPTQEFALPGRRYRIEDANHAKAALSMVSRYGTPEEQATVDAAVHAKYGGGGSHKDALVKKLKGGK